MTPETAAEIAARYGAGLAPGAALRRVPVGATSLPLPVWDGRKLVVPGHREAARAAAASQAKAAMRHQRVTKAARLDQLRQMHADGLRPPAMAEALGVSRDYVYQLLAMIGLRIERDPAQYVASAARMVAARKAQQEAEVVARNAQIAGLVRQGLSLAEIGAALGVSDGTWLRRLIRRAVPDHVLPVKPRGPAPKAPKDRSRARQREAMLARDAAIVARHVAGETVESIALAQGVTALVVVKVLGRAGQVPLRDRDRRTARRVSDLPRLLAEGMTTAQIAALWGVTSHAVYQMASRAGVSLRATTPPPHNAGKTSARVAARRARVADMVRAGCTDAEILRAVGVHQSTLSEDIRAVGLSGTRRTGGDMRKAVAA